MKLMFRIIIFYLLCAAPASLLHAQNERYRPIDEKKWEKATDGLDYTVTPEEPQELDPGDFEFPEEETPFSISIDWLKVVLFAGIAVLLIFILLRIFGRDLFARNKKVKTNAIVVNDLEEKPMESDLERFLREALESGNYRLAVRIYYLMILKSLHDKNLITWRKNKTNFDYLLEVSSHPQFHQLNNSTLIYEYVWYGEKQIAEPQFNTISRSFLDLIGRIDKQP